MEIREQKPEIPLCYFIRKRQDIQWPPRWLSVLFLLGQSSFIQKAIQLYIPQPHKSVTHRCPPLKNAIVPQGIQKHHAEKENSLHTIVFCIPKISEVKPLVTVIPLYEDNLMLL